MMKLLFLVVVFVTAVFSYGKDEKTSAYFEAGLVQCEVPCLSKTRLLYNNNPCDDPNAAPPPAGCSFNCDKDCSNYFDGSRNPCPHIACPPNECGCKADFFYDKKTKKCVRGPDCSLP